MVALNETITVVNKSGKIVSTSKHLVNVFKEARSAYLERKAELKADKKDDLYRKASKKALESRPRSPRSDKHESTRRRNSGHDSSRESSHSRRSSTSDRYESSNHRHYRHDSQRRDSRSGDSRHADSKHRTSKSKRERPSAHRGYSDSFCEGSAENIQDRSSRRTATQPISPSQLRHSHSPDDSDTSAEANEELRRRYSDSDVQSAGLHSPVRGSAEPAEDTDGIDMALAYGELPPPLPTRPPKGDEEELKSKVTTLQRLLEEANCVEHSVRAVIKNLEENPDAMAAVALTLAEISNLAAKMAPGALASLKGSFPVVVALLASPEFLIGGGVALGVTVVAFGGYKIIKRIRANRDLEKENAPEELEDITSEVDRIDNWRRGIRVEDVDTASVVTSVDGEFITPKASMQLREQGVLSERERQEADSRKGKIDRKAAEKEDKKREKAKAEKEKKDKSERERRERKERKEREKDSEPSAFKTLFKKEQVVP